MPDIFSLAGLRSLGLEEAEDIEEEDKLDPIAEGRPWRPPPATPAPAPSPGPRPLPLLRFLPDTGKGRVEAGLLSELCLLSGTTVGSKACIRHKYSTARVVHAKD